METLIKKNHKEGKVAKWIENKTAKLPSDVFLWSSFALLGLAVSLRLMGRPHTGLMIGQLVSPILIMGLYNKLVKVEGHDRGGEMLGI
jgi:hypothetical protein